MLKTEKREVVKVEDVPVMLTCNKCGAETDDVLYNENYHEIKLHFGYGSQFDTELWQFHLCEECLIELVKAFKIAPLGFGEENIYGYKDGDQEESQKNFDLWVSK